MRSYQTIRRSTPSLSTMCRAEERRASWRWRSAFGDGGEDSSQVIFDEACKSRSDIIETTDLTSTASSVTSKQEVVDGMSDGTVNRAKNLGGVPVEISVDQNLHCFRVSKHRSRTTKTGMTLVKACVKVAMMSCIRENCTPRGLSTIRPVKTKVLVSLVVPRQFSIAAKSTHTRYKLIRGGSMSKRALVAAALVTMSAAGCSNEESAQPEANVTSAARDSEPDNSVCEKLSDGNAQEEYEIRALINADHDVTLAERADDLRDDVISNANTINQTYVNKGDLNEDQIKDLYASAVYAVESTPNNVYFDVKRYNNDGTDAWCIEPRR